ncbi:hypothetical protein [Planobispora longispora]|uniref:Uncharacterized protein n=1 Tax=Planobispora longispora TaxID=28887 RepID=A0A8J3W901_9ACTN|nr:hypothetical protein [Planobispora longispora]BFE82005.1 hypothetical protein GCM10020093_046060 [Planobispora longispora]GIH79366.1 hypothetical protein Plo01_57950 [Planobispora longispora]
MTGTPPRTPPAPAAGAPLKRSFIGDLRMKVIYRILAVAVALVVAAAAVVAGLVWSGSAEQPGEERPGQIAAPSTAAPSSGPASSAATTTAAASPTAASPTPESSPTPDGSAVKAALADPRVPELPADKRLGRLPGKAYSTKSRVRDEKSGVSLIRFGKPWKPYGASPFATRQVLPAARGAGHRAMLVSCPVPTLVQATPKDTALLAARWTLNHHPEGGRISWVASQPTEDGWLLAYKVVYKVKGKTRSSMAAVALTEVSGKKPALVFMTIPDSQRARWRDINTAMASISPI